MSDSSPQPTWLVETTDATFETDVLIRSQLGLVIVDFWAEWCAPCRMLAPVLEKVVEGYAGEVTLVKANADQCPASAAQFGVQGIPALYGVFDGQVLQTLQGAVPEATLRQWIDRQLTEVKLRQCEALIEEDPQQAEARLRELLQQSPQVSRAKSLLLVALHRQGRTEEVRTLLTELEQRGFLEPEVERVKVELQLQENAAIDVEALEQAVAAHPEDFEARLQLAQGLAARQEYRRALELLLEAVEQDRQGTGELARQRMVELFRVLGDDDELTREFRRRLSLALY
ncbi:MAG: thioredoxin [Pirellulaceae bacterium]|nr:MAG: thioredoxin [Pirellulaceae bacterium]